MKNVITVELLKYLTYCSANIGILYAGPSRGGETVENFPQAPRRLRAPPSLKTAKYTKMHHFEKQN